MQFDFPQSMKATPLEDIDKSLKRLQYGKAAWSQVTAEKRLVLLKECMTDLSVVADEWIHTSCRGKGIQQDSSNAGEEWIGGFMPIMRNIRLLIHALKHQGQPPLPGVHQANDQSIVKIFPMDLQEKLLFQGFDAEVWIEPGKPASQGKIYRQPTETKVCLVLGAGNQGSIGPMDCLYKLFVENEICILKMNPVNDYLGPYVVRAFRALIEGNFLSVVYGGVEQGKYLCQHELVDSIHITGSGRSHDAIVWGSDAAEQQKRKAANDPLCKKPITSELGCVSPILVVPGKWSAKEMDYQARQIVSMVTHNASYNCNAGKVLVMPKSWEKSEQLMTKIQEHLRKKSGRTAFYPGSQERYQQFLDNYPDAIICGERNEHVVPWTILPNVPAQADEYALNNEAFCGVLAVTYVNANTADAYLTQAVSLCNDHLFGTLSCNMLIDPRTQKSSRSAFHQALRDLRYGSIAVNAWSGVNYGLCSASWGAYPGHTLQNIGSGIGIVHNTFMLDYPQKSIVKAPFVISPTPAWFYDNRNLIRLGQRLLKFEQNPSWLNFVTIAAQALRG